MFAWYLNEVCLYYDYAYSQFENCKYNDIIDFINYEKYLK